MPGPDAAISLREVTEKTVRAICNLKVLPDQDRFVAPNAVSIAEAYFARDRAWFRAVYADGGSLNVAFGDMCRLVEAFGLRLARISGSHHIHTHPEIPDLVNLQNDRGQAKPYQIRQFLKLVEEYNLKLEDEMP